jgi:hypothetical protein
VSLVLEAVTARLSLPPNTSLTPVIPMSETNQSSGPSTDNFTTIFNLATTEYQTVTGNRLDTHPLATQLKTCDSPEAISDVLRTQAQAFSKFRKGDEKLMAWLDPIVYILFTFSATLGEGIGLVSPLIHSVFLLPDIYIPAILTREDHLHWDRCSSRGMSLPNSLSDIG